MSSAAALTIALEIQTHLDARGFDLALSEEQAHTLAMLRARQADLDAQVTLNRQIQLCIGEYQRELCAELERHGWTPCLTPRWQRVEAAAAAFDRRLAGTDQEIALVGRCLHQLLRQILVAVERGEV